jgi:hypothetical protein
MTRPTPPKNEMIPRIRSGREKKRRVLEKPIVIVRPAKKSTSPSANMAGSNKKRHPRNRKTHPKKSKPVPILVLSLIILEVIGVALRCSRSNGYRSSGRLVVKDRAPCLLSLLLALLCRVSLLDDGCFCRAAMWRVEARMQMKEWVYLGLGFNQWFIRVAIESAFMSLASASLRFMTGLIMYKK